MRDALTILPFIAVITAWAALHRLSRQPGWGLVRLDFNAASVWLRELSRAFALMVPAVARAQAAFQDFARAFTTKKPGL